MNSRQSLNELDMSVEFCAELTWKEKKEEKCWKIFIALNSYSLNISLLWYDSETTTNPKVLRAFLIRTFNIVNYALSAHTDLNFILNQCNWDRFRKIVQSILSQRWWGSGTNSLYVINFQKDVCTYLWSLLFQVTFKKVLSYN